MCVGRTSHQESEPLKKRCWLDAMKGYVCIQVQETESIVAISQLSGGDAWLRHGKTFLSYERSTSKKISRYQGPGLRTY
jgi:hypothetical protein